MTIELNERQLRLALENVPLPVLAHDETGRIRFLSDELLRVTGYAREQIPTFAAWLALVLEHPADIEKVKASHRVGYEKGAGALHTDWEYPIRLADGSRRSWRMRAFAIGPDDDGLAVNVSVGYDLTAERATLDALERSQARLTQALRIGGSGHFERDYLARRVNYSDELMRIHGLDEARRVESYEQWFARVHPADRGRVVAYAEALLDRDPPLATEFRITRLRDGAMRRIAERREVRRDEGGRVVGSIGVQRDVTEARAAEQALRDSEARLRLTLEVGHVGIFDWDLNLNALAWDERLREIFGLAPHEPVTIEAFYEGLHEDDLARLEAAIAGSHDPSGDGAYDAEYRVLNKRDGRIRHIAARGRTLFEHGRATRMMGVVVEVTALREAQAVLERDRDELERLVESRTRELAEAQTRLAHAQRMEALGQLAGGIAHDFNNVLQAVEAAADLIERRPHPEHLPRYLKMAREATKRGSAISRRLSSLSSRSELEPERVDVPRLIEEVAGILRRTLGLGVTVETQVDADCPAAFADRRQLETALLNLAANAREAMNGAGHVRLAVTPESAEGALASDFRTTLKPGPYVRIEVVDDGRGMDPDVRARAAEPFFSTKPRGQGAGLGLSMAKGFADQSGGALRIDSAPGAGARVAIWLPLAPSLPEPEVENFEGRGRGRLLLVDDDPLVRELVGEQLRCAGFNVTSCGEGRVALERIDAGAPFDVLLTDFAMPEMNGVALAREARKRRPTLPVIVLTGYASEVADAAAELDLALLRKPIESRALVGAVSELIAPQ